jgi:hypothetical protein
MLKILVAVLIPAIPRRVRTRIRQLDSTVDNLEARVLEVGASLWKRGRR